MPPRATDAIAPPTAPQIDAKNHALTPDQTFALRVGLDDYFPVPLADVLP